MSNELAAKLARRCQLNEDKSGEKDLGAKLSCNYRSVYAEFKEFPLKKIRSLESKFKQFDQDKDNALNIEELKKLMEGLGEPQTHRAVKDMIALVDDDKDGKISFREKQEEGELENDSGLDKLAKLAEIDVSSSGVSGAKNFFQAKVAAFEQESKITDEIRQELEAKKQEAENARLRREEFKRKQKLFG
ncbi:Oidioi.mRNA.OKI2018_I69.chr2.g6343.t1.cds [Oikopleura dioica]|uniref:Oidioi.mRNA.OKI2018_I69.chr2.g6343.t1.cds n=1 Tax=Oikopleura dioica TaxID=34765 RepID=A0ABN7T7G5_OIKDI|nr:Oidioi.mRNA.OKI2018_I69.chr2.g6343.t1.cds [Oikopleura dioica]